LIIVIKIKLNLVIDMMKNRFRAKSINICSGPGCRAWDSEKMVRGLAQNETLLERRGLKVCRVRCMNKCGGGVSVKIASCSKMIKLKSADHILKSVVDDELLLQPA
jgi:hypothetical protein